MSAATIPTPLGGGIRLREEAAPHKPGESGRLRPGITVVIPTIPPRRHMLLRALASAAGQSRPPDAVVSVLDTDREGAAVVRDRGLAMVQTEWVAFLDDDDEFGRHHLALLEHEARTTGADLVFPWFHVIGGSDPWPDRIGLPWNIGPDNMEEFRHIPITVLVKTRIMRSIGGFAPYAHPVSGDFPNTNEDLVAFMEVCRRGHTIVHFPERTWMWHHHGGNLSGRPAW